MRKWFFSIAIVIHLLYTNVESKKGVEIMLGFVGMRELSNNTKRVMVRLKQKGSLILTDNGKPIAALIPIKDEDYGFEKVYDFVKQYELEMDLRHLTGLSKDNPNRNMTMDEINEEIAEARKEIQKEKKKNKK